MSEGSSSSAAGSMWRQRATFEGCEVAGIRIFFIITVKIRIKINNAA